MRRWCQTHPVLFMAGYLVFYLAFFALLEHRVTQPAVLLHCRLDDLIPFCKYAVVPYFLWFAWVPATLLWLLARAAAGILAFVPAAVRRHDPLACHLCADPQRG